MQPAGQYQFDKAIEKFQQIKFKIYVISQIN